MMNKLLRRLALALSAGYILFFFSEAMFWARWRAEDTVGDYAATWLTYSVLAFAFLTLVSRFRVRSAWALFLVGAVFGWLTEGAVVQTMYDDFPLNVSFTGLAWHASISVMVGWYLMRKVLIEQRWVAVGLLSGAMGLFWGVWAVCWWVEAGDVASLPAFGAFACLTSLGLIPAYHVHNALSRSRPAFAPTRWEVAGAALFFAFLFVAGTLPAVGLAGSILPLLLAGVWLTLHRNRRTETRPPLTDVLSGRTGWPQALALLSMPATATLVYGLGRLGDRLLGLRIPTHIPIYLVLTGLGFILLALSVIHVWRRPVARTDPRV